MKLVTSQLNFTKASSLLVQCSKPSVKSTDTGAPNIPKYEQFFLVKGELLRLPPPSQNRCESYRSRKISYKSFLE